jgi:hypothetical protein
MSSADLDEFVDDAVKEDEVEEDADKIEAVARRCR